MCSMRAALITCAGPTCPTMNYNLKPQKQAANTTHKDTILNICGEHKEKILPQVPREARAKSHEPRPTSPHFAFAASAYDYSLYPHNRGFFALVMALLAYSYTTLC